MSTRPEVLSPAGDEASMLAAIKSGADAVYFGIRGHNARARAQNFGVEDLPHIMGLLHRSGVKGYVPMNILAFDHELEACADAIAACADAGVDALIVQDLGVCRLIRAVAPTLPIHASTQMTCTDAESVAFAESVGASRIVLARELSLDDIAAIRRQTSAELEVFVHGALCVSYSGQCLTSEAIGGRSANRGACAQACRLPYDLVVDGVVRPLGDIAYLLSPEDLEAASLVPQLAALDVHCLKIEGRLKGPEYVAAATALYRAAVDALEAPPANGADAPPLEAKQSLNAESQRAARLTFSRGSGPGFLAGVDHQRLVDGETCDHVGLELGVIHERVTKKGRSFLRLTTASRLKRGDGVLVAGGRAGVGEVGGRIWDLFAVDATDAAAALNVEGVTNVEAGTDVWLWLGPDVDARDVVAGRRVFQTDDPALDKQLLQQLERTPHREALHITVSGDLGTPFVLNARSRRGLRAQITGDGIVEAARNHPLTTEGWRQKLDRLGDSPYVLDELTVALPEGVTVPVSAINRARRQLVEALEVAARDGRLGEASSAAASSKAIPDAQARLADVLAHVDLKAFPAPPAALMVLCRTQAQAEAALDAGADGVWLDFLGLTGLSVAAAALRERFPKAFIGAAPPRIRKPGEEKISRFLAGLDVDGFLVRSLGPLQELSKQADTDGARPLMVGDFSLNVTNRLTVNEVMARGLAAFTPSFDLDEAQLTGLLGTGAGHLAELVVHHPMPLFHTEHCVFAALLSEGKGHDYRTCGRPCESHQVALRDRAGLSHPVEADVGCRNTVFHERAQSAAGLTRAAQASGVQRFRIELVRESTTETATLVTAYRALLDGSVGSKETLRRLKTASGYGVVKGSLRVLDQPAAEMH